MMSEPVSNLAETMLSLRVEEPPPRTPCYSIDSLPIELLEVIMSHMDKESLAQVATCSGLLGAYIHMNNHITEQSRFTVSKILYNAHMSKETLRYVIKDQNDEDVYIRQDVRHLRGWCYLRKPEKFVFVGQCEGLNLRKDWWNEIENFTIKITAPVLPMYYQRLQSCRMMHIFYNYDCKAEDFFKAMPMLDRLLYGGTKLHVNDRALEILAENSKKTNGLRGIEICKQNVPAQVTADGLIAFMKNVKLVTDRPVILAVINVVDKWSVIDAKMKEFRKQVDTGRRELYASPLCIRLGEGTSQFLSISIVCEDDTKERK